MGELRDKYYPNDRHGDTELVKLNYIVFPDKDMKVHTRVDIVNEAAKKLVKVESDKRTLKLRIAALEEEAKIGERMLFETRQSNDGLVAMLEDMPKVEVSGG